MPRSTDQPAPRGRAPATPTPAPRTAQQALESLKERAFEFWSDESIKRDYAFHPSLLFGWINAELAIEAAAAQPHTHALYDCGGKGHGSDVSEVQWCHDCTPHTAQPQPSGALREALLEIFRINNGPQELLGGAISCPKARFDTAEIARAALAVPAEPAAYMVGDHGVANGGNVPAAPAELGPGGVEWRGTIPTTCHFHRVYDCWQCRPRIAIEAASDEDKARAIYRARLMAERAPVVDSDR